MKFYQTALVALLAASASTTTQVVNAQDEEGCTSVLDLACGTEGFSALCSLIMATAGDLPDGILDTIKTAFAPTVSLLKFICRRRLSSSSSSFIRSFF
jgi:hypothetical protein